MFKYTNLQRMDVYSQIKEYKNTKNTKNDEAKR